MTVTITGGPVPKRFGESYAQEQLTQSTATAAQALNLYTDLSLLGGGTATGIERNLYSLASGIEGQRKVIKLIATGEAHVSLQGATATDLWVFNATNGIVIADYVSGAWVPYYWRIGIERFSQSTATAFQRLNPRVETSNLGAGTATGFGLNQFFLPDAWDGVMKTVRGGATGEAKLIWDNATATGQLVFTGSANVVHLRFALTRWWIVSLTGATFATST